MVSAFFMLSGCLDPEHEIEGSTPVKTDKEEVNAEDQPAVITDPTVDTDGDGVPDVFDLDDDNDGIPDQVESNFDADGDGIPNSRDLDSDNDGISDLFEVWYAYYISQGMEPVEALVTVTAMDTDNDGVIDVATSDSQGFGRYDGVDVDGLAISNEVFPDINAVFPYNQSRSKLTARIDTDDDGIADSPSPFDTDGDGVPDSYDLDSDGDGVPDVVENGGLDKDLQTLPSNDGVVGNMPDGIRDEQNTLDPVLDNDGDGIPNYLDTTSNGEEAGFDIANPDYDIFTSPKYDLDGDGVIDNQADKDGDGIADIADGNDESFGHGLFGPEQEPTFTVTGGADGYMVFSEASASTTTIINVRYQCQLIEYKDTQLSPSSEERPNAAGESYWSRSEVRQIFKGRVSCGAETNDVIFFLGGENQHEVLEQNQNRLYLGRITAADLDGRSGTSEEYIQAPITPELLLKGAFPELETMANPASHPAVINMKRLLKSLDIGDSEDKSLQYPANNGAENNYLTPDEILIANIVHEAVQADSKFANTSVLNQKYQRETFMQEVGEFFANTAEFESIAEDLIAATEAAKSGNVYDFTDTVLYTISETGLAGAGSLLPASAVQ